MNGYVVFWDDKKIDVHAANSYEAQQIALREFQKNTRKRVKSYHVIVFLAELGGEAVTHTPDM